MITISKKTLFLFCIAAVAMAGREASAELSFPACQKQYEEDMAYCERFYSAAYPVHTSRGLISMSDLKRECEQTAEEARKTCELFHLLHLMFSSAELAEPTER